MPAGNKLLSSYSYYSQNELLGSYSITMEEQYTDIPANGAPMQGISMLIHTNEDKVIINSIICMINISYIACREQLSWRIVTQVRQIRTGTR